MAFHRLNRHGTYLAAIKWNCHHGFLRLGLGAKFVSIGALELDCFVEVLGALVKPGYRVLTSEGYFLPGVVAEKL